jgi:hypothetical protein
MERLHIRALDAGCASLPAYQWRWITHLCIPFLVTYTTEFLAYIGAIVASKQKDSNDGDDEFHLCLLPGELANSPLITSSTNTKPC